MLAWLLFNSAIRDKFDIVLLEPNFVVDKWSHHLQVIYLEGIRQSAHKNKSYKNIFVYTPILGSQNLNHNSIASILDSLATLSFPYIVNTAAFPFYETRKGWLGLGGINSLHDALNVLNGNWSFDLRSRHESSLEMLKARERECDIRLSSFIEANAPLMRLFYAYNHPSLVLGTVLYQKVLRALGLPLDHSGILKTESDSYYLSASNWASRLHTKISPYVYSELEWSWSKNYYPDWNNDARVLLEHFLQGKCTSSP
jgi:hypothetical protein